jgi:hypothetical protein
LLLGLEANGRFEETTGPIRRYVSSFGYLELLVCWYMLLDRFGDTTRMLSFSKELSCVFGELETAVFVAQVPAELPTHLWFLIES